MINKLISFAMAIASRGLKDSKIDLNIKKLRYISCFGTKNINKCSKLQKSNKSNFFYCGACGCGDHSHTWLIREEGTYSKLDYPNLDCPLKMPGFTNYDPNSPNIDLKRKKEIESLEFKDLSFVNLTISVDEEKRKIFEELNKIIKNS